jgi:hypothetical protein
MVQMPDLCTIKLEIENEQFEFLDFRTSHNLDFFKKSFESAYNCIIEDTALESNDIFGPEVLTFTFEIFFLT